MSPDFQSEREKLEAKLTALLLGELPAHEEAALNRAMDEDPELTALYERLKVTIHLVRSAEGEKIQGRGARVEGNEAQHVELKLPTQKREKLLAHFKTIRPKEFVDAPRRTMGWVIPLAASVAIVAVLGAMLLPALSKAKSKSMRVAVVNNLRLIDGAKQTWALEANASQNATPRPSAVAPYFGRGGAEPNNFSSLAVAGETYVPGKVNEQPRVEASVSQARRWMGGQRIPADRIHDGRVQLYLGEIEDQKLEQNPAPQVAMNTAPQRASIQNITKSGPGQASEIGGQDASAWKGTIRAKGEQERPAAAQPFTPAEVNQTATLGLNAQPAASPPPSAALTAKASIPKTEIVLPASNEAAGNEQLALNNSDFGKFKFDGFYDDSANKNGQFYTGLPHDDEGGLRYRLTNEVVASQPIADNGGTTMNWNTFDGSTNSVATRYYDNPGSAIVLADNSAGTPVAGQTPIGASQPDSWQIAKDTERTRGTVAWTTDTHNKAGNITLANESPQEISDALNQFQNRTNGVQTGFASAAPEAAPAAPQSTPKTVKALPFEPSTGVPLAGEVTGGFDGAGSVAHLPKPAVGGKQVEMAAAANQEATRAPTSKIPVVQSAGVITANGSQNEAEMAMGGSQPAAVLTNVFAANVVGYIASDEAQKKTELASAEQELENEKRWRDILKMKTGEEQVDKDLPKGRMVTIVEPATTATMGKVGLGEKLRETFSGKVEKTASVNVEQEHRDIAGAEGSSVSYDPYFLQTELSVIQSDAVLKKAAEFLNADKNGSGAQVTVAQLKKDLDLRPIKNSKEIQIGARSETAGRAVRIANAVAAAYRDYRLEQYTEIKSREMQAMQQQMADQERKVEVAQAKVDELAKESHAPATVSAQATNPSDTALPKPAVPPPTPQPEILTRENAFSTFSMNVSDVSFKLAAASLEKGQMPEPASIRSEEFINAFDYRDPEAAPGVPVAFNYERALYPFAHNRELLRFSLKTAAAGRQAGRPLNIVLLLDNSGSMERADRVRIIQEALRVLAGKLQAQDTFSIVTFARTARLRVDGIPGNQAAAATAEVGKFTPEGGTDLGDALDVAYETALHHYLPNGDNRVVLLTDGAANLGDVDSNSLKQKVETHRKQGIALDCFGIGWEGYNDDLLEVLTRDGDGRYGFINTPEEASTEFVSQIAGALHVAAADVKVQVEFNPDRVISYRQIGYAKHQLTKEQFRDNTVAAGQIAAQEAGNALYTIEINPQGQGSIGTVRVRYKVPDTGEIREQSWDVPYTGSAVSLEQSSPAMRLAATASAFSEWLATSPFAEEVTTDQLLNCLNGVPQVYGADARPQKLEWMIRQAKSISGK